MKPSPGIPDPSETVTIRSALPHSAVARPDAHMRQPWLVSVPFKVPRAFLLASSPQSNRHCCTSIAATEQSAGGLNGGRETGATAAGAEVDGSAVAEGSDDSLGAGAVAVGPHAVTKDSNPTARRSALVRMTEP
jgi:hypothetical protein